MSALALAHRHRIRLLWAGFAFLYVALALLATTAPAIVDERVHYVQINLFDHRDFRIADQYLTMLPGYHVLVAGVLWLTDFRSIAAARMLNALFGLLMIAAFCVLRARVWRGRDSVAALQFALLPILLPYDFLVYTDVLSLALVLAAAAATLRGRHRLAGLLMVLSMGIRQINVIWLPLLAAIAIWPSASSSLRPWRQTFDRLWPYIFGVAVFVAYWSWNGSISFSKEQVVMHPDFTVHIGNLYFALFLCGLLFPLHVVAGWRGFAARVVERPWIVLFPVLAFAVFWTMFRVDHPYNQVTDPVMLHNVIIQSCESNVWCKAAFGLIAIAAACGLAQTRLQPAGAAVFYPVAAVALSGFWMIEQRYALIPLAFWLAFRQRRSEVIESATTALWLVLAVCACLGTFTGRFSL